MNYTRTADLARSAKGVLPVSPYLLDTPHDALAALTLSLAAAVIEARGLVSVAVTSAGSVLAVDAVAVLPDGRPVQVIGARIDAAGLADGTQCLVVLTGEPVLERHTVTVGRETLTHDMQTGAGRAFIVAGGETVLVPVVPDGAVLLARFRVQGGAVSGLAVEQPAARVRGAAAAAAATATRYGPDNRAPLSDGYGPDVPTPEVMPWAEHGSFNPRGWFAEFVPDHDCVLSGLDDAHQIYSGGQVWRAYVWDVVTLSLLGKSAPADTGAPPRVAARFPAPVQLRAGRRYRIGWGGEHSGDVITVTGNRSDVALTYPGFTTSAGAFDNYSNRDNTADLMPPGGGSGARQSFRLLLASDYRAAGVSGRLQPGALPVSASVLTLADGEGYVYTPAGGPPEWRYRQGATEYRLPFVAVGS